MPLLAVAAWEPELERFRSLVAGSDRIAMGGPVGVGLVEAAIGMTRLLAARPARPEAVLFVGTCGAFASSGLEVGDVVAVARSTVLDVALARGGSALPAPMPARVDMDASLVARAGLRAVHALTTLGVTIDDALATELGAQGEVEHLEVFAVARACAAFDVPFVAILGVANPVGSAGRAAWLARHVDASARAAERAAAAFR